MRHLLGIVNVLAVAALLAPAAAYAQAGRSAAVKEDYVKDPIPPGFHVEITEFEGPVFADARGRTLYTWPLKDLRNGDAGEQKGKPSCDGTVYTENSGLMSPYPPGLILPELDKRPSCIQLWPPVLASADAKPVAKWSVVTRPDGAKQWAYDGFALYTSVLDRQPGDVNGATKRKNKNDAPADREPVGPRPNVPAQFAVYQVATGRLLTTSNGYSVYASDNDGPNKSNCDAACTQEWSPILAPEYAQPQGEWTIIERSPGVKQWAYRSKPLYRYVVEEKFRSFEGSDVPGWRNVYTQKAPPPPKEFTVQDSRSGQVLADKRGMTIYVYMCGDDALDQLACDHPDTTQVYRYTLCGGGDPARCLKTFPYVIAAKDAKSESQIWSVMAIDPKTGKRAAPGQADALYVWAYRDRPVYNFAGDQQPGDIEADAWGEFNAWRNGFKAFWLRDDFREKAG